MIAAEQVLTGPLEITIAQDGSRRTLALSGEFDLAGAEPVERELDDALADESCRTVVIDLAALEFIDSSGIAVLLRALRRDNGQDRLRFVPSRALGVVKVLELTGVDQRLAALEVEA